MKDKLEKINNLAELLICDNSKLKEQEAAAATTTFLKLS